MASIIDSLRVYITLTLNILPIASGTYSNSPLEVRRLLTELPTTTKLMLLRIYFLGDNSPTPPSYQFNFSL